MTAPCSSTELLPINFGFVESIPPVTGTATTVLDLNDGTWCLSGESSFPPPDIDRAEVQTLMVDGEHYPASVYRNRALQLVLTVEAASTDDLATQLQLLFRQLDKPQNIILYQPKTTRAVYFRTFRVSARDVRFIKRAQNTAIIAVDIPAEPFAYASKEQLPSVEVSNDPADTNGDYFDVTGIMGDVETPLVVVRPRLNKGTDSLFAVRRRGTPANAPFLLQAEDMSQQTDTTTQPNSATFSGSGNNYSRCTFATDATLISRVQEGLFPAGASVDYRGTYRVFARLRKNGATSEINVQLLTSGGGTGFIESDIIEVTWTSPAMVDFGLVSFPVGADPVFDGYSGVEVPIRGNFVLLTAERVGGSDTLDIDFLLFVPADDRLAIVHWSSVPGSANHSVLDSVHRMSWVLDTAANELISSTPGYHVGGMPMVSPGVTNRIYHINEVFPADPEPTFPTTWDFDLYYWPRYLRVAPVAS